MQSTELSITPWQYETDAGVPVRAATDGKLAAAAPVRRAAHGTILVLGAGGITGRRVAERLVARGLPVRLGSRSGTPPFDWENQATWGPALCGVDSVFLPYAPDLAAPGAVEKICLFTALAVELGVRRLVLLSLLGEEDARCAEEVIQGASAEWTILRSTSSVDPNHVADVAVAALTEDGHAGRLYALTGKTRPLS